MKKLMKHFCFLSMLFVFTLCNYDNCFVKAAETQLSSQYEVLGADIWSDVGNSCTQGAKVTLAAKGKGGSGSYTYKFLIQDTAGNWGMLQDYSTNNKIVWDASVAGKKTLYVDIKDSTGKVVRKSKEVTVVAKAVALEGDIWSDMGSSCTQGTKVTLAAKGKGGSGSYTYKFLIQDAAGNWGMLQNYSTNNKIVWNANVAGKKTLYVDIKDSTGKVVRKSKEVTVVAKAVALEGDIWSDMGSSCTQGTKVTLAAKGKGGSGSYTYKFLIQDAAGNWGMLQNYSTNNKIVWNANVAGKKTLYVDIKDSTGKVVRKSKEVNVIAANPLSIKYFGIEPNKVVVGERINLSAMAEGGSGIYTYKFLMQDVKTGGWYMIQDYSSKSTATWIPGSAGERKLFVDVKDSTGKVVRKEIQIKCNKSLGEEWELPIM